MTRHLLSVAKPFQYYGEATRSRRSSSLNMGNRGCTDSAVDTAAYSSTYDSLTKYIVCAICGYEGSRAGCVLVSDIYDLIEMSGIAAKFDTVVSSERAKTRFDAIFNSELNAYFQDGLIRGFDSISRVCSRLLLSNKPIKKESPLSSHSVISEQLDSSDDQSMDDMGSGPICPKHCLFQGLFCGSIPDELKNLTSVEESMINIYSAVISMILAGGKHYQVRGSTSYTIINDLANVASELPRMPTADCTSVLRHVSTRLSKDYTYRPNRVYRALNWLKRNNHLYEHVKLKWSAEILDWANNEECVDIPFIEVTDEEEYEIDEVLNEIPVPGDTPSYNNPGIYT